MASDQVTEFLNKGYVEAQALYEDDRLSEAIEKAEQPLEEQGLPRYHRVKCDMIIAACVDDWEDAADLFDRAESLWQMVCMVVTQLGCEIGAERDEEAELALVELRDEIDSLKRHHASERPDEGVDTQADEDEPIEQGLGQLRGKLEEDELDEETDVDEVLNEGEGVLDVTGAARAEEQDIGAEKAELQPKHIEEEKEMANSTSALPFRPT